MPTIYPPSNMRTWSTSTTTVSYPYSPTFYVNGEPVNAETARQIYDEAIRNGDWNGAWNPSVGSWIKWEPFITANMNTGVRHVDLDEIDAADSKELDEYLSEFNISEEQK